MNFYFFKGRGCRKLSEFLYTSKWYKVQGRLGMSSKTMDLEESEINSFSYSKFEHINKEMLENNLNLFRGEIERKKI